MTLQDSTSMALRRTVLLSLILFCGCPISTTGFSPFALNAHWTEPLMQLRVNLASDFLISQLEQEKENLDQTNQEATGKTSNVKLSRPERKALERVKKAKAGGGKPPGNRKKQNNYNKKKDNTRYDLHSTAVAQLTCESTADDVLRAIKRAQNLHDAEDLNTIETFLLDECDIDFAYGYRGSLLSRLAVAALHMNNHELARKAMDVRHVEYRPAMMPHESAAIIRGLLRVHNVTDALDVLDDELSLPLEGTALQAEPNRERLKHRALALASIASRHFFEGEPSMSVRACRHMAEMGPLVREAGLTADDINMPWARLIRGASQCEAGRRNGTVTACEGVDEELPCNLVYSVLTAMTTFPSDNSDRIFEGLSNALVRRVLFITGAIDMNGCPPGDRGEAAFIGRSNVGKSSLINMVTNRKSLAYTSKRPGKTQQFNFFAINDKPGREKEIRYGDDVPGEADLDSFYIVDLPGFGFAKVPQKQREEWARFMQEYLSTRKNLKVVFHLIDSRHGPTDEDKKIMKRVSESLPSSANYVVVLTKSDKNVKGAISASGKVSQDVMKSVRDAMNSNGVGKRPVILSSANTKLGRDDLWRYLRLAAEA